MKRVTFSKQATKTLSKIPPNIARNIRAKIDFYARDSQALASNVKRLHGMDYYRLRVGDWRVVFDQDAQVVAIIKIAPRSSAYE